MKLFAASFALQPGQLSITSRHNAVADQAFFYTLKLLLYIALPKGNGFCNAAILIGQEGCHRQQPLAKLALSDTHLQLSNCGLIEAT